MLEPHFLQQLLSRRSAVARPAFLKLHPDHPRPVVKLLALDDFNDFVFWQLGVGSLRRCASDFGDSCNIPWKLARLS